MNEGSVLWVYSKGLSSNGLLVWLHSNISIVDVDGEGVGSGAVINCQVTINNQTSFVKTLERTTLETPVHFDRAIEDIVWCRRQGCVIETTLVDNQSI